MDIEEKVKAIIAEKLDRNINEIHASSVFKDLGADSLDTVELIMEFEKEFDIKLPDDEAEKILTVGDAINVIKIKQTPPDANAITGEPFLNK